jgi:glycosyltransferase involved in cell wall biosynthesis
MLRVLYIGENWFGSCARACCYALRRLGCEVHDVDIQTFVPQLHKRSSRAIVRLLHSRIVEEFNDELRTAARQFRPDFLLAFKGLLVHPDTLRALRGQSIALFNYYPDTSAFAHGALLPTTLPEYDCIFYTKRFWDTDVRKRILLKESIYLPHGYDSEIFCPWLLSDADRKLYGNDVIVIATHTAAKEALLDKLVGLRPNLDLRIWGYGWSDRNRSTRLTRFVTGRPLYAVSYAKAAQAARINLGVMSGVVQGASVGDETTTRTYEIPAAGGFMLHQRSAELMELFEEGKEVAAFGSVQELAEKIDYYLAHPEEREAIAAAGHRRCVPAYSYDVRMSCILDYYRQHYAASGKTVQAEKVNSPAP